MPSVSSNLLIFAIDFALGNKEKSRVDKSEEYGCDLILEFLVLPKSASFIFDEFCEPNETILPHNIPYSPPYLVEQILCE
jgi:hypothetical protein